MLTRQMDIDDVEVKYLMLNQICWSTSVGVDISSWLVSVSDLTIRCVIIFISNQWCDQRPAINMMMINIVIERLTTSVISHHNKCQSYSRLIQTWCLQIIVFICEKGSWSRQKIPIFLVSKGREASKILWVIVY